LIDRPGSLTYCTLIHGIAAPERRLTIDAPPAPGPAAAGKERSPMPLYLDIHNKIEGLTTDMAAEAHKKDLAVQGKYGVNYIRYWYDEGTGKVFCLCQAPSKEAAEAVHREAHGGVADQIIEVKEGS
jgi:hypothetical protein